MIYLIFLILCYNIFVIISCNAMEKEEASFNFKNVFIVLCPIIHIIFSYRYYILNDDMYEE